MTRWRCCHKWSWVILVAGTWILSATCFNDPITSWPCKQPNPNLWLVQRFKPRRFQWYCPIFPDLARFCGETACRGFPTLDTWPGRQHCFPSHFPAPDLNCRDSASELHFSFSLHWHSRASDSTWIKPINPMHPSPSPNRYHYSELSRVHTQKNVRGEVGGWGRVPFNEPYAPSLSTIYDGA